MIINDGDDLRCGLFFAMFPILKLTQPKGGWGSMNKWFWSVWFFFSVNFCQLGSTAVIDKLILLLCL